MSTTVVNCRRDPQRVQRYVGRATMRAELRRLGIDVERVSPGPDLGLLGNPQPITVECTCGKRHGKTDVAGALRCYARYLLGRCLSDRAYAEAVERCRGLVLGCWCDGPCHGLVLADVLDRGLLHDVTERAAIMEHDGQLERAHAEAMAIEWALPRVRFPATQASLL